MSHLPKNAHRVLEPEGYPECSGDPASCPENEGYGCCRPNPKAVAQEGQQAGPVTKVVRDAQAGECGTITLSMRRSEWRALSPEAQKLIESRVLDRGLLRRLALEHARGAEEMRGVALTADPNAPAKAEPIRCGSGADGGPVTRGADLTSSEVRRAANALVRKAYGMWSNAPLGNLMPEVSALQSALWSEGERG